jgi:hypothetical protein
MALSSPDLGVPTQIGCAYDECDHDARKGQARALWNQPHQNWIVTALEAGWVVVLWRTPGLEQDHPGGHTLAFCCAWCQYREMRDKLLRQQGHDDPTANYADLVVHYEELFTARSRAEHFRRTQQTTADHHRHRHEDGAHADHDLD